MFLAATPAAMTAAAPASMPATTAMMMVPAQSL
jgi:hypothetical protein